MPKSIPIACVFKAHGRDLSDNPSNELLPFRNCLRCFGLSGSRADAEQEPRGIQCPALNALEVRGRSLFFRSVMLQQSGGVRVTLRGSLVQRGIAVLILRIDVRSRSQQ